LKLVSESAMAAQIRLEPRGFYAREGRGDPICLLETSDHATVTAELSQNLEDCHLLENHEES
jgi:hypothetical protein